MVSLEECFPDLCSRDRGKLTDSTLFKPTESHCCLDRGVKDPVVNGADIFSIWGSRDMQVVLKALRII